MKIGAPQISILLASLLFVVVACRIDPMEPPIDQLNGNTGGGTPFELEIPDGFPPIEHPVDNPLTVEGVSLGRMLFYDPILSADSTLSCASCHNQEFAFTDDGKQFSTGIRGLEGKTNSMAIINVGYGDQHFWNGRAFGLEHQATMPVIDPLEMDEEWTNVVAKIEAHPTYPGLFGAAFGTTEVTQDRVTKAIAQFERTVISGNSKYDRIRRFEDDYTNEEFMGRNIFFSEVGDCFHCHNPDLLTDNKFHNNGLDSVFGPDNWGLYEVTGNPSDIGKFKTGTLRNIELTAPYMHDGRFATLEEVIDHYNTGIVESPTLDPLVNKPGRPVLTEPQKQALIAFLKTLTDTSFVNNPAYSNPFN